MIKLRTLKGETLDYQVGPKHIACILVRMSLRHTHMKEETHRRDRGNVMTEAEVGVMQPQVTEYRQP